MKGGVGKVNKLKHLKLHDLTNFTFKVDHFQNIYRLQPIVEGAPNFRQVCGFNIFGMGQPSIAALPFIFNNFQKMGLKRCVWFNMRSEPVIYVNGHSYAPCDPGRLTENLHLCNCDTISPEDVDSLQQKLTSCVRHTVSQNENRFSFHKHNYAPVPSERFTTEHYESITNVDESIFELPQFVSLLSQSQPSLPIHLHRLHVDDERAPNIPEINTLIDMIWRHSIDPNTAILFNCQMGKGRTTYGMIIACLIQQKLNEIRQHFSIHTPTDTDTDTDTTVVQQSSINGNTVEDVPWPNDIPMISMEEATEVKQSQNSDTTSSSVSQRRQMSIDEMAKNGNYILINNLITLLTDKYNLNGNLIKDELDNIIDRCQHLQNVRQCIYVTKQLYTSSIMASPYHTIDSTDSQHCNMLYNRDVSNHWQRLSQNFVERYFILICINAYLTQCTHRIINTPNVSSHNDVHNLLLNMTYHQSNYSEWLSKEHADIISILGTHESGPLSDFHWQI